MKTLKSELKNYYAEQLAQIEPGKGYPAQIKVNHETGQTKWLSLNDESANELVKWLKENYNITQ